MTHGQQCACIWAITIPLHLVIATVVVLFTSSLFAFDFPFKSALSFVWMFAFGAYVLIGPMLIYNRIEDAWNRGRSLSRRS